MTEASRTEASERPAALPGASWLRRAFPYAPALAASSLVGVLCMRAILRAAGRPAAPLDDTFIHLQYARRLAEGGFFSYVAGEGYTTGATSLLWPLVLAPFHAVGLRGLTLLWVTWLLGLMAHAGVTVETARLAQRLAGRAAGLAAGAMCTAFGAFAWFAWSGMETVPLAWALMRTARVAAARCEPLPGTLAAPPSGERRWGWLELVLLGVAGPLLRPEGAIASVIAAVALFARPPSPGGSSPRGRRWIRLVALAPLAGPLVQPALNLALAGHAASSTTAVKWLLGNPYYGAGRFASATLANARLLFENLLNGGEWTTLFLPEGFSLPLGLGAVALVVTARRARLPWHATFVACVALGTLLPCTYLSFLWNRVRYIRPFAGAWFVLLACLARELGELARRTRTGLGHVGPIVAGCFVGALITRLPWTIRDLAQSARAIDRQQVTLGEWAREHLPQAARVGVNDTGAIAYLGGRATFDVVGLTTEGEAKYWVAGAGSRFEHYERMPLERLPTHFIVYPHWMACPAVLGRELTEATVVDQSILGGTTMVAYEARWDLLASGALPTAPPAGELVDEIDVADLVSEAEHGYELAGAWDQENQAMVAPPPVAAATADSGGRDSGDAGAPEGRVIADGVRTNRTVERFLATLPPDRPARLVARLATEGPTAVVVRVDGREAARAALGGGTWIEHTFSLPPRSATDARARIEIAVDGADETFTAAHYWIY